MSWKITLIDGNETTFLLRNLFCISCIRHTFRVTNISFKMFHPKLQIMFAILDETS